MPSSGVLKKKGKNRKKHYEKGGLPHGTQDHVEQKMIYVSGGCNT